LSDFFSETRQKEQQSVENIQAVIKKLLEEQMIQCGEGELLYDLYDYLERLRIIFFKQET
jgi:DNA-binding transcriptional regulator YbjK